MSNNVEGVKRISIVKPYWMDTDVYKLVRNFIVTNKHRYAFFEYGQDYEDSLSGEYYSATVKVVIDVANNSLMFSLVDQSYVDWTTTLHKKEYRLIDWLYSYLENQKEWEEYLKDREPSTVCVECGTDVYPKRLGVTGRCNNCIRSYL